jgi:hypothetical protein
MGVPLGVIKKCRKNHEYLQCGKEPSGKYSRNPQQPNTRLLRGSLLKISEGSKYSTLTYASAAACAAGIAQLKRLKWLKWKARNVLSSTLTGAFSATNVLKAALETR